MPYFGQQHEFLDPAGREAFDAPRDLFFDALWDQARYESPSTALIRNEELNQADYVYEETQTSRRGRRTRVNRAKSISVDEVAEMVNENGVDLTPTPGHSRRYWEKMIETARDREEREGIIARRGESASTLETFGVALGAASLDPLNIGLAFLPVVGEARYASMLAEAGGALGRFGVRARVGATEGAVGSVPLVGIQKAVLDQEQADYSATDMLLDVVVETALGGILRTAGGALRDAFTGADKADAAVREVQKILADTEITPTTIPRTRTVTEPGRQPESFVLFRERMLRMSDENRETVIRTAVNQVLRGEKIDVQSLIDMDVMADPDLGRFTREALETEIRQQMNDVIQPALDEFDKLAKNRINKKDRKAIEGELKNLQNELSRIGTDADYKALARQELGPKAKVKQVLRTAAELRQREVERIDARMDEIDRILAGNKRANQAREQANQIRNRLKDGSLSAAASRRAIQIQMKLAQLPDRIARIREQRVTLDYPAQQRQVEYESRTAEARTRTTSDAELAEIESDIEGLKAELGEAGTLDVADREVSAMDEGAERVEAAMKGIMSCMVGAGNG